MCTKMCGVVSLGIGLCLVTCLVAGELGPEWKLKGGMYERRLQVLGRHSPNGNVAGYDFELDNHHFEIAELDGNKGFTVRCLPYGELNLHKNSDGSVARYVVVLNKVRYYDLNGDGMLDSMSWRDARFNENVIRIVFEDKLIAVGGSRGSGNMTITDSADGGKTTYVFEDGKWRVKERVAKNVIQEQSGDEKRQALWEALQHALPHEYREIAVYAENRSLTKVLMRSKGATLLFTLESRKVEVIDHMKAFEAINCITFETAENGWQFVLWHNGHRELAIPTEE